MFKVTNKGFTLIELLVVIAIIALLSSVVLASIQKGRTTAQIRKFEQELINIRTAIQLYREKNNGNWPYLSTHINTLTNKLYTQGFYNKSTVSVPKGFRDDTSYPRLYYGYKTHPTYNFSCGGPNHQDVYLTLVFGITDSKIRSLTTLPKAYYRTNTTPTTGYHCIEIR